MLSLAHGVICYAADPMKRLLVALALTSALACSHPTGSPAAGNVDYDPILAAPDRSDDDKALDAGRHPHELLTFMGVRPGMRVGELAAGTGYTTELLARVVAPTGKVYAQNPDAFVKFLGEKWPNRLARPANAEVVRVDREMESPLPPEATNLDIVVSNLVYHDFVWMGADRGAMNRAVFDSLKPGGLYVVLDHSAAKGHGIDDVKTLHRIDEQTVVDEIVAAGFKLDRTGEFLRNPEDTRDWSASPSTAAEKRGTSDRFALRFVKP